MCPVSLIIMSHLSQLICKKLINCILVHKKDYILKTVTTVTKPNYYFNQYRSTYLS